MAALETARLFEEMLEKQRMEEELALARGIQRNLLPTKLPDFEKVDIAAVNIPSREVGGDYYDVIPLGETRFGVAIADVAGKGAGAAMLMANLQASLHALVSTDLPISDVLCRINRFIFHNTGLDKFITFFYGELDIETGVFTYSNAGHNPPMKLDKQKQMEELNVGGIVLGMMENVSFDTATVRLIPGDALLLYTDGITETMNSAEEEFGESGVLSCFKQSLGQDASQIIERLINEARKFSGSDIQADDMTMVMMKMQ
jgi:sigma-B regulation protein RsbU (phosphoserine phosphatase)